MRQIIGLILFIILISPYIMFFTKEIIFFFKKKYELSMKNLYYKGIYSLCYWFIGIIPLLVSVSDIDSLPRDKVTFYGLLFIPLFFFIDLIIVLMTRRALNSYDINSDEYFYLKDYVGGKNASLWITIFLNIAYLIDYLLIFMTIFGVIYG